MADPTLQDLVTQDTEDASLEFLTTTIGSFGFPVVNWQSGGVILTILRAFARALSEHSKTLSLIAAGGILKLSKGDWLTLLADWYSSPAAPVARFPPTFARGFVNLTLSTGNGPFTIVAGQIIIHEALKKQRYFSDDASVLLPAGPSTTQVDFLAEHPGSSYNVASTVGIVVDTPLPGLTATFYVPPGSNTWLTAQGTDEEQDADLRTRCHAKWGTIGFMKPADAYLFLALNTPGVGTPPTKTVVVDNNPRGPNTVDVWLANLLGPIPTADEALIRNYILGFSSPCADVQVANAATFTVNVSYTLRFQSSQSDAPVLSLGEVTALIQGMLIGGLLSIDDVLVAAKAPSLPRGVTHIPLGSILLNSVNADLQVPIDHVAIVGTITIVQVLV